MTLHDWIDELCDVLDLDIEVDEALVLDLARVAAHSVERPAAPISTFLLGYAAAVQGGSAQAVEELAARATTLAEKWAGEDDDPDDVELPDVPDDVELVDIE